jgi:hypothetical protein
VPHLLVPRAGIKRPGKAVIRACPRERERERWKRGVSTEERDTHKYG